MVAAWVCTPYPNSFNAFQEALQDGGTSFKQKHMLSLNMNWRGSSQDGVTRQVLGGFCCQLFQGQLPGALRLHFQLFSKHAHYLLNQVQPWKAVWQQRPRSEVGGLEAGGGCISCMQARLKEPLAILHQNCISLDHHANLSRFG